MIYKANCMEGYYQYDRYVHVHKKLNSMPYAQAGIIYKENGTQLISYETIVCEIIDNWLHCYGTFSNTTRKHIGAYMKEMTNGKFNYYTAKKCFETNTEFNIKTGEIREASAGMIQTIGLRNKPY